MSRPPEPPRLQLRKESGRPPVWLIVWSENGRRRRRSTGTSLRREADRILQEFRTAIKPDLARRPVDEIAIADLLNSYGDHILAAAAAPERAGYAFIHLIPFWANLSPLDVTEASARAYFRQRQENGAASGTVERELGVLSAALGHAVKTRVLPSAPKVWKPARPVGRPDWLNRSQIAEFTRLARAMPQAAAHLPWFILLGYYSGARSASVLELQWRPSAVGGHINTQSGLIDFNPRGRVQSKKRRAVIPMPAPLWMMMRLLEQRGTETVIADRQGNPIKSVKRSFGIVAAAAGARYATPHTLRHSCITQMLLNGVSSYDVSKWAAISLKELERTYGHHSPDYLDHAAASWAVKKHRV